MRNGVVGYVLGAFLAAAALVACGGGGGGDDSGSQADPGGMQSNPTVLADGLSFENPVGGSAGIGLASMLVDATNVYWFQFEQAGGGTGGSIRCVPQAGGTATTLAGSLGGVSAIAQDATHIYYTEYAIATGAGSLRRVPKAGGGHRNAGRRGPTSGWRGRGRDLRILL